MLVDTISYGRTEDMSSSERGITLLGINNLENMRERVCVQAVGGGQRILCGKLYSGECGIYG